MQRNPGVCHCTVVISCKKKKKRTKLIITDLEEGSANLSVKGQRVNILELKPYGLCCNYSVLLL
jgi:hypothetical protein